MYRSRAIALAFLCSVICAGTAVSAWAGRYRQVYTFKGGDGAVPVAGLLAVGDTLYGTTLNGGHISGKCQAGCGVVFSLDPKSGAEQVLHAFGLHHDGAGPGASLIDVGGALYGTTTYGGDFGWGTIFTVDPKTGAEKVVHAFGSGSDGAYPTANLTDVGGVLYGTTYYGGTIDAGTVFSFDPKTGTEKVLFSFVSSTGYDPGAGLINVGGTLYGTTVDGGHFTHCSTGCGTVFSLDPKTNDLKVVYYFAGGSDGATPFAGLINVDGTFYGTTFSGGGSSNCDGGCGTVFSLGPKAGTEEVLHSFTGGRDGFGLYAGLIDFRGTLYGTTTFGGAGSGLVGFGTVFTVNPKTGSEKIAHVFGKGNDGISPEAGLIDLGGNLYGTTLVGGRPGQGTVFAITP